MVNETHCRFSIFENVFSAAAICWKNRVVRACHVGTLPAHHWPDQSETKATILAPALNFLVGIVTYWTLHDGKLSVIHTRQATSIVTNRTQEPVNLRRLRTFVQGASLRGFCLWLSQPG